jgi:hypothetical protein
VTVYCTGLGQPQIGCVSGYNNVTSNSFQHSGHTSGTSETVEVYSQHSDGSIYAVATATGYVSTTFGGYSRSVCVNISSWTLAVYCTHST